MSLKGGRELAARLRAIKQTFKVHGREWGDEYVVIARPMIPSKTGKTRRMTRVRNASQKRVTIASSHVAYFIDKGTVAHDIRAKRGTHLRFEGRRGTVFARRVHHPRTQAHPFRERAAREALRRKPMVAALIKLWNDAA